ncbi:MAG: LPXTG cell wall anchor domain-containing protein [Pseudomonadales bacterium]|nr:LPXTG cell wall anchor domain-containing protein [Pseudomonadales bacterium]
MKFLFAMVAALFCSPILAEGLEPQSTGFIENYALVGLFLLGIASLILARRKNESPQS